MRKRRRKDMAAARVTRKRQLGYALKRRIAALDPEEDHEEVARLTLEVLSSGVAGRLPSGICSATLSQKRQAQFEAIAHGWTTLVATMWALPTSSGWVITMKSRMLTARSSATQLR